MAGETLEYERLMQEALRGVVRKALSIAATQGLRGQHHFYITFRTPDPGVVMPDRLRKRHPGEMTIVLQYQFWGLEVGEDNFAVTLSFEGAHERLVIPWAAIVAFVDPSVQFGLQFPGPVSGAIAPPKTEAPALTPARPADQPAPPDASQGRVIALDTFRKK
ncbi:MAG: SspB family protein [Pseudomonadota bacterium]